jgi:ABC-type multidrug transport system ATPase subunit
LAEISEEVIVILSTHIVDDVRELCHRMAIINRGQVVLAGDPRETIEAMRGRVWSRAVPRAELASFTAAHTVISTRLVAGTPIVHVFSETNPGDGFAAVDAGLEDVYFHRIGASVSDDS